jgi:hypothetical protein
MNQPGDRTASVVNDTTMSLVSIVAGASCSVSPLSSVAQSLCVSLFLQQTSRPALHLTATTKVSTVTC